MKTFYDVYTILNALLYEINVQIMFIADKYLINIQRGTEQTLKLYFYFYMIIVHHLFYFHFIFFYLLGHATLVLRL